MKNSSGNQGFIPGWGWLLGAVTVLILAAALLVILNHGPFSARLGNSVVRVHSVTVAPPGGVHAYFVAPLWRRKFDDFWLRHIGPSPFSPPNPMSAGFTSDDPIAAAFWITRNEGNRSISPNILKMEITDEHGCIYSNTFAHDQSLSLGSSTHHVAVASFSTLPRREQFFSAKIFFKDSSEAVSLRVENPFPKNVPQPPSEPLPISRKLQGSEFVLTGFNCSPTDKDQRFQAGLEIRTNGITPAFGWGEPTVEFEDLTGNQVKAPTCRHEKTYKVIASFFRSVDASFSPSEIWKLKIRLPGKGQCLNTNLSNELPNGKISICAIMKDGSFEFANETCTATGSVPTGRSWLYKSVPGALQIQTHEIALLVRPGIPTDRRLLVKATDETGHILPARAMRGVRDYIIEMANSSGAREVALELMIEKPLRIEYIAQPEMTTPSGKVYESREPFSWTIN